MEEPNYNPHHQPPRRIYMTDDSSSEPQPQKKKRGPSELVSTIIVIVLAPVVALLLTIFVFQSYEVDGPSMESALQDNDRLIVNKLGKTWSRLSGEPYIPKRYGIIVFNQTSSTSAGTEEKQLIKRVIGLPGDRIVIKNGDVKIFNHQYPNGLEVDRFGPESEEPEVRFTEGNLDLTVEENEVFVLGDNRKNSLDSRSFGAIDSEQIVGELTARIYPIGTVKKF